MPAPSTASKRGARASRARGSRPAAKVGGREAPGAINEDVVEVNIEELSSHNESVNWMIYGPSGAGKTVLAGHAPRSTFLSTEKGVISAKIAGSTSQLIRAPHWEHVVAGKRLADKQLKTGDWLIADSITKMQVLNIRWILRKIHEDNDSRDLDIPAIQDHQKWQNYFKRFIDELIDAPYNVIFIATEMRKEDEEGEDLVLPAITGKNYEVCNYIRAQMDIVSYYAVAPSKNRNDPITRRLMSQPYPPYVAKDRYDALGRWWDVPDGEYDTIIDMITEIEKAEKKAV